MANGIRLLVMAALSVLAFSGCGSGGGRSGTSPDSGTPGTDAAVPDSDEQPVGTAELTLSKTSVDLGVFDMGLPSAPVVVTVTNTGNTTSGHLSLVVTGDAITANGCEGAILAPQATCTITIIARSQVGGPISGTVEVGDSPATSQKITVTGIVSHPGLLQLTPSPLDLGKVLLGKTATGTMVLTNATITALSGIRITVSGAGYSLSAAGTCTGTLAIQESCNIVVNFSAGTTTGLAKGAVTVSQGTVTRTVAVTATVWEAAEWRVTPDSAALQTAPGTPSSPATFHVICSDVNGAAPTVTITGANKDDFSFTTKCDKPLPGEVTYACQIDVVYNPKPARATNSTATLTVVEGDLVATAALTGTVINSDGAVPLDTADAGISDVGSVRDAGFASSNDAGDSGSSVGKALISVNPPSVDLGVTDVGMASPPVFVTVTNVGTATSGPLTVTVTGVGITAFGCNGLVLAPKGTCQISISARSVVPGTIIGAVEVGDTNNPKRITVSGIVMGSSRLSLAPNPLDLGA
jgi:hypothetical protein